MIDIPGITSAVATPAIWLNEETMAKYRPELKKYYYNPTKYKNDPISSEFKYPTIR